MRKLKNWDNKTWLSSKSYIFQFNKFLKTKFNFNKNSKILDIGCGRANIISALQKKYKFKNKPIGIDIVANRGIKRNIVFKKIDALNHFKKHEKYDLILIKQTIHFFSKKSLNRLLNLTKKSLNPNGKLIILSLKTKNNKIPYFKKMKLKLNQSLKKDKKLISYIKKNLSNYKLSYFKFKVNVTKKRYLKMIKDRYISCLLKLSNRDIKNGISEINLKYKKKIHFIDTLLCISFRK